MNIPVIINKNAKIYSIFFLIFWSLINILKLLPKIAQTHIDGKQTKAAVIVKKAVANKKFSSAGKKPDTTVIAIVHAFGFMNWKAAASYNFKGLPLSFLISLKDPIIVQLR